MSHVVALAQAEAEENPKATPALREFGGIRPQDAEKRGNEVLEKHGLTAPIRIDGFDLDESKNVQNFPYIKFSTWVEYLLTSGKLPRQLCACVDLPSMKLKLAEFWFRYESIYPMHQIFAMRDDGLDLSLVIPVFLIQTKDGHTRSRLCGSFQRMGRLEGGLVAICRKARTKSL